MRTLAEYRSDRHLTRQQLGLGALVQIVLDPLVTIATLLACILAAGEPFEGPYLILALIVFSLTFPGDFPKEAGLSRLTRSVLASWTAVAALLLFIGWATRTLDAFDPKVVLLWIFANPFALIGAHALLPALLPRLLAAEGVRRTAVIAGDSELGRELRERIRNSRFLGIRFAGYFEDRHPQRTGGVQRGEILGSLSQLAAYAKTHRVDLIYITLPMASRPRILRLLEELRDTTASIYFVPDIFLFDLIQARVDSIGGMPVVAVCETPFYGLNGIVKRASDIAITSGLLALCAPVMLAIAIAIKLTSPGPALFAQRRYGLDGREITVYKFRTMTVLEDGEVIRQATRDDRRITPLGAFLRCYSLDELPQLINVLEGSMSLVGPRPHAVAHNEMYRKLIGGYMIRHKVKPGITGLAQVSGLRGETDTLDKMKARIECDLDYLRNWSLKLDLQIALKTIVVVLKKQNAY